MTSTRKKITLNWVPGHVGVAENREGDKHFDKTRSYSYSRCDEMSDGFLQEEI